jgi:hypothetical protein
MARVGEALVFHDPRYMTVAALNDDDMLLVEVSTAYLVRRYRYNALGHLHPVTFNDHQNLRRMT